MPLQNQGEGSGQPGTAQDLQNSSQCPRLEPALLPTPPLGVFCHWVCLYLLEGEKELPAINTPVGLSAVRAYTSPNLQIHPVSYYSKQNCMDRCFIYLSAQLGEPRWPTLMQRASLRAHSAQGHLSLPSHPCEQQVGLLSSLHKSDPFHLPTSNLPPKQTPCQGLPRPWMLLETPFK